MIQEFVLIVLGPPLVVVLAAALVAFALWRSLMGLGSRLDRAVAKALVEAIQAKPVKRIVVDPGSGDAFRATRFAGVWAVARHPHGFLDEAIDDFHRGARRSTVSVTLFLVQGRRVAAVDHAYTVRPPANAEENPVVVIQGESEPTIRQVLHQVRLLRRAGTTRVSAGDVEMTTAQLLRASPPE